IPVPVNTLLRSHDYCFILSDSQCKAVIYSAEYAVEIEPALDNSRPETAIQAICIDGFQAMISEANTSVQIAPTGAEDDCFWLYSSGSTGNPKGVIHRHRDMVVTSQRYGVETLAVAESDTCFSAAKLFFAYGLGNAMTFPLWVGATTILDDTRPTPESIAKTIAKFKPTLYFAVPTLYVSQLQAMPTTPLDSSSIRYCV
ncbi:MAG: AMP-binding protein, partial [Aestuariibacter sp.]|nr:AMP-binding protein [Aestuariibacter sp.]